MAFHNLSENIRVFVESLHVFYKILKLGHIFLNTLYNKINNNSENFRVGKIATCPS